MKNFETILQDVKAATLTQYERGFDFVTLALVNVLNKNLRKIIVKKGKDPDKMPAPPPPTKSELIKSLFSDDLHKRSPRPFSFVGSPPNDWVKDETKHPILKSRDDFEARVKDPSYVSFPVKMDLPVEEPEFVPPPCPAFAEIPDLSILLNVEKLAQPKKKTKPGKKRYSLSTGKLLTNRRSR